MLTQIPYVNNPLFTEFLATILRTFPHGLYHAIMFDQTAFYPTSGGQMHDTGTINSIEVVDMIKQEDEKLHLVNSSLKLGRAECQINWQASFRFHAAACWLLYFGKKLFDSYLDTDTSLRVKKKYNILLIFSVIILKYLKL